MKNKIYAMVLAGAVTIAGIGIVQAAEPVKVAYVVCIDKKTKALTQAVSARCSKSQTKLDLAAKLNSNSHSSTIVSGSGAPLSNTGNAGDLYFDLTNSFLYGPKTGLVWPAGKSLVGAAGLAGSSGSSGQTGATGATGTSVQIGAFPKGFGDLARIQTELVGCCDLPNNNVALSFSLLNLSGAAHSFLTTAKGVTDFWIQYYDINGTVLPTQLGPAHSPTSWSYVGDSWDGSSWLANTTKSFRILVAGVHAEKPLGAVFYSLSWRPNASWVGTRHNGTLSNSFTGDKLMITEFATTGY